MELHHKGKSNALNANSATKTSSPLPRRPPRSSPNRHCPSGSQPFLHSRGQGILTQSEKNEDDDAVSPRQGQMVTSKALAARLSGGGGPDPLTLLTRKPYDNLWDPYGRPRGQRGQSFDRRRGFSKSPLALFGGQKLSSQEAPKSLRAKAMGAEAGTERGEVEA